jgi:glycine betaine/proline transport system substrate-binding protein
VVERLAATLIGLMLTLGLCAGALASPSAKPLRIAYVNWSSSVASANLVCVVVRERLGRRCELRPTDAEGMWRAVAENEADVLLSAWLPDTHAHYMERYGERLVDFGPNLEGTRIGLVVPEVRVGRQTGAHGMRNPAYVSARTIGDLRDSGEPFHWRIVGIDPGAGIMRATRNAMARYGLDRYRLIEGSEQSMTEALAEAIARQEGIVITGWVPHWMFDRWSLRFLDDPKGVYGGSGEIHTLIRPGLAQEMPRVADFLDRFHWSPEEMNRLLIWNRQQDGLDPYGTAARWVRSHPARVDDWLKTTGEE